MSDDTQRWEGATSPDLSRSVATGDDIEYSLSVEEALARYEAAGLPRTPRSIQRYCAKGHHLKAHLVETPFGDKFLINPESVDTHIAYIKEVQARPVATSRDMSRQATTSVAPENKDQSAHEYTATGDAEQRPAVTSSDMSRPVATDTRIVELLERENDFLRGQIAVKDEQIKDLTEHARSTNFLIGRIASKLPLLGVSDRPEDQLRPVDHADDHPTE